MAKSARVVRSRAKKAPNAVNPEPEYVYFATHTIYFSTENPVPIADVIASLQAIEGLLQDVPKVVAGLTNSTIKRYEFYVESIESGSLWEKIGVKLFFANEAELDAFLDKIRENGVLRNTIVAVAFGALVTYGALSAVGAMKTDAPNITANNNVVINIGAGEVKLTPEAFQSIVAAAVSDKKANAANAVKFLAPAKNDTNSSVQIQADDATMTISPEAIAETPKRYIPAQNKKIEDISKVVVEMRASDLDSKKSGWAGKIEGMTGRVKVELDPAIIESELFGKSSITADVTLISTVKSGGSEFSPNKIFIRRLY